MNERTSDEVVPVELLGELRIEGMVVPHRRGQLYRDAADRIEALERENDALRKRQFATDKAAMELTAALAQMAPGYEAGETEFLSRDAVMELVVRWRMKRDAAPKTPPSAGDETDLRRALEDIAYCRIPGVPNGCTVGMEQYGPFAMRRAREAIGAEQAGAPPEPHRAGTSETKP